MRLEEFRPRSQLVTKATPVMRPRFPVVDAHNHLADPFGGGWDQRPIGELLDVLDRAHVRHYVDLDGGWGEAVLHRHLDLFKAASPERFSVFGGVDWSQWPVRGHAFPDWAAGRLRAQASRGAAGIKIWKDFGLRARDDEGNLIRVDDPRLDPVWQTCGELRLPVLIHVADPVAFFEPVDAGNERWEELQQHPDWSFIAPSFPPFRDLVEAMATVIGRHPQTTFIGAHVGCYAENLAWVGALLARCPNFYVDISARLGELGRQPYSARRFFLEYADRILFGLDLGPDLERYRIAYRFLETDDEYFAYGPGEVPQQGRWSINGLFLPPEVLEKVYYGNAKRILGLNDGLQ